MTSPEIRQAGGEVNNTHGRGRQSEIGGKTARRGGCSAKPATPTDAPTPAEYNDVKIPERRSQKDRERREKQS